MSKRWSPVAVEGDWTILKVLSTNNLTKEPPITPATTEELISAFKETRFFANLIKSNTIAIYVVGSRAIGLDRPISDLDLIVIVDDEKIPPEGREDTIRLKYKGLAVHWRFYSYKELFAVNKSESMMAIFRQQICFGTPRPIYLDSRGEKLNAYLIDNGKDLTKLGAKLVAFAYRLKLFYYIGHAIRPTGLKKPMYHFVMASEILSETVDIDFLTQIKFANYKSHLKLSRDGLMDRLNKEIQYLIKEVALLDYDSLVEQVGKVNNDILLLIES